jgi:hypothetical protein
LRRPLDAVTALDAMLGLSTSVTRQLVGVVLATSPEAEALLERMPHLVRSLTVSSEMRAVRHTGEVRGPVLWSQTAAARSASAGAGGVYVCASPSKAFDTEPNRVLVSALVAIRDGGHAAEGVEADSYDDPDVRRARENGARAIRFMDHRTLVDVARVHPTPRGLRRARAGSRRHAYERAVAMLERTEEPFTVDHIRAFCDPRTSAQHDLLVAIADGLSARGIRLPPFIPEHGDLRAGPVIYRHQRSRSGAKPSAGILVADLLLDIPERRDEHNPFAAQGALRDRAGAGRRALVVMEAADMSRAVEAAARAVEAATVQA